MRNPLVILFIVVFFGVSCSSVQKTSYQDKGLTFKVTPDFRIGRTDRFKKNQATYIPIYGRDKSVYAKFSVVWIPYHSDLDWEIQNYIVGLNSVYESDTQNRPLYSEVRTTRFGSNDARQIDYTVPNDGPRIGSYTVFHCDSLTIIIGQHCTVEGRALTQRCRELIETTYVCSKVGDKAKGN
jgi:hypothetical protein